MSSGGLGSRLLSPKSKMPNGSLLLSLTVHQSLSPLGAVELADIWAFGDYIVLKV
jgi:hypothetical protein